jgi:hypothetical protein
VTSGTSEYLSVNQRAQVRVLSRELQRCKAKPLQRFVLPRAAEGRRCAAERIAHSAIPRLALSKERRPVFGAPFLQNNPFHRSDQRPQTQSQAVTAAYALDHRAPADRRP